MTPIIFKLIPHAHVWKLERADGVDRRYFRTADQAHAFARKAGASRVVVCDEDAIPLTRGRVFGIDFRP